MRLRTIVLGSFLTTAAAMTAVALTQSVDAFTDQGRQANPASTLKVGVSIGKAGFMEDYGAAGSREDDVDPGYFVCPANSQVTLMWQPVDSRDRQAYGLRLIELKPGQSMKHSLKSAPLIRDVPNGRYELKPEFTQRPGTVLAWQVVVSTERQVKEATPGLGILISDLKEAQGKAANQHERGTRIKHNRWRTRWWPRYSAE